MFEKVSIEVGACSTCNKQEVCSIRGRRQDIVKGLEIINDVNGIEDPFKVTMSCRHYSNRIGSVR